MDRLFSQLSRRSILEPEDKFRLQSLKKRLGIFNYQINFAPSVEMVTATRTYTRVSARGTWTQVKGSAFRTFSTVADSAEYFYAAKTWSESDSYSNQRTMTGELEKTISRLHG